MYRRKSEARGEEVSRRISSDLRSGGGWIGELGVNFLPSVGRGG